MFTPFVLILFLNNTFYTYHGSDHYGSNNHGSNNFNFFVDKKYENKLFTNFNFIDLEEFNDLEDSTESNEIDIEESHNKYFHSKKNNINQPIEYNSENKIKYVASFKSQ